ncbi:MAG: hypothetical protein M0R28_20755 [Pigmentiphaga sp.]|nr:hypothetical protein [Pigmentiphaga sp.]
MLTAKEQEVLAVLKAGRKIELDDRLQRLIASGHVIETNGVYHLTDRGLDELRLAKSFGEAIAGVVLPGAGTPGVKGN